MTRWKHPTAEEIQRATASYFRITYSAMLGKDRRREFVRPRQIAMYLTRSLTSYSLPQIGTLFGGRDHTTVLHACRVIAGFIETPETDDGVTLAVYEIRREFMREVQGTKE